MDEIQFFDKLSSTWDENEIYSTPEKVNEILDYLNIKLGDRILDLGTGTGVLLPYLSQRIGKSGQITAVDYSTGMLNRAISKYGMILPRPIFLNLDFENEIIQGEFDKIILYCVYPHLHHPVKTLKKIIKQNLKEGGILTIAFPCNNEPINKIHEEKHSESGLLPTASSLAQFLKEQGLNAEMIVDDSSAYVINVYQ